MTLFYPPLHSDGLYRDHFHRSHLFYLQPISVSIFFELIFLIIFYTLIPKIPHSLLSHSQTLPSLWQLSHTFILFIYTKWLIHPLWKVYVWFKYSQKIETTLTTDKRQNMQNLYNDLGQTNTERSICSFEGSLIMKFCFSFIIF